ncbi:MAG: aspartyl/asparaginyl beta-hydroxylase domain-containing protein [Pseudomonadota bacterium]
MLVLVLVVVFILPTLYVHYRGKVRLKLHKQLVNHSALLAPINVLYYACSKPPNQPFIDRSFFPDLQVLQDHWPVIRQEAEQLLNASVMKDEAEHDIGFNSFFKYGWRRFYLKWYGDSHPSAIQQCPTTVALLEQVPSVKAAMFAMLPPGGRLNPHRDPYAGSLRYHLGMITPNHDDCAIVVDGQAYSWRDGDDVIFDETFVHEAYNRTDQNRLIFFADLERPMRSRLVAGLNRWFSAHLMAAASSPNHRDDRTGVVNRMYRVVHRVDAWLSVLKRKNRPLFRTCKYVLIALLLYLLLFTW